MPQSCRRFQELFALLSPLQEQFAVEAVKLLLDQGRQSGASDLHLLPQAEGRYAFWWRIDGVLSYVTEFPQAGTNIVNRLKVLAGLLTYRTDIPQEGRLRENAPSAEVRVSTFPTVHGEKVVVRLFAEEARFERIEQLGLPRDVEPAVMELLTATSGAFIVAGPSGAGKTTTLYACLRTILHGPQCSDLATEAPFSSAPQTFPASADLPTLATSRLPSTWSARAICTLEDPVECLIPGVAQTALPPGREMTYARGLSSLMRQDPDVILVGEIRDRETAETVFQAALTGHLVLTSFHAGRAVEAIGRLLDMSIEPYVLRSGLLAILAQRLLRRSCRCTQSPGHVQNECLNCGGTGYHGRLLLAEFLAPECNQSGPSIIDRAATSLLAERARAAGVVDLEQRAKTALKEGWTTREEAWRVFGRELDI